MMNEIEMPRLKRSTKAKEILARSLVELQRIVIDKIEENRAYQELIDANKNEIDSLNQRIKSIESNIKK